MGMKTRDGHEIKTGRIYYWVTEHGLFRVSKVKCRRIEKRLVGYMPTTIMTTTHDQDFSCEESRNIIFKDPKLAKTFCLKKLKQKLKKLMSHIEKTEKLNPQKTEIEK
jgi:hypothetical protein